MVFIREMSDPFNKRFLHREVWSTATNGADVGIARGIKGAMLSVKRFLSNITIYLEIKFVFTKKKIIITIILQYLKIWAKKKWNEPISVNVYICRKLKHWSEKFRQKLKPSERFANLNGLEILNCYVHVGFLSNLIEIISLVFPFITNRSPCSEIQKP